MYELLMPRKIFHFNLLAKIGTTPGRRLMTYATYDRPHLRPQKS
jgi:hypothetical protein